MTAFIIKTWFVLLDKKNNENMFYKRTVNTQTYKSLQLSPP